MRTCFILLCCFLFSKPHAQTVHAVYQVRQKMASTAAGVIDPSVYLTHAGHLYRSGGQYIYFQRPLYLTEHPTDKSVVQRDNNATVFPLFTDSLQHLRYNNTDSLISRSRSDVSHGTSEYVVRSFETGAHKWQVFQEKKDVNGMQCQLAKYIDPSGRELWEAWFTPSVEMQFGPSWIRDIPGLVVEAHDKQSGELFTLQSLETDVEIAQTVFWPEEFSTAKFIRMKPLLKN